MQTMINVTKTFLPPIEDYVKYLEKIWDTNQITNNGPLVQEIEIKLKKFLDVKHLFFVNNGTIGLQIAIRALNLKNEIITTPFSYVATTSTIVWEGCKPTFVDIDPQTLCMDHNLIENAITEHTTGILATHVFGIPCAVEEINKIAKSNNLQVIYDAAHTFGGKFKEKSIVSYGDISILSFHATKVFHTIEGGAIITNDDNLAHRINYLRNFGHRGETDFWGLGINGKNTEFHAAMGLCNLPFVKKIIEARKRVSDWYDEILNDSNIIKPNRPEGTLYNYAYYPILFPSETLLIKTLEKLNANMIYPRRYFYPSLNYLPYVQYQSMPIAEDSSKRILCLPIYDTLEFEEVLKIVKMIRENTI